MDLIHNDSSIDVFEFWLTKLLESMLNDAAGNAAKYGKLTIEGSVESVHILFATLARCGSDDEQEIRAAYVADIGGMLKVEESELLHTACALLHCPMPMLH